MHGSGGDLRNLRTLDWSSEKGEDSRTAVRRSVVCTYRIELNHSCNTRYINTTSTLNDSNIFIYFLTHTLNYRPKNNQQMENMTPILRNCSLPPLADYCTKKQNMNDTHTSTPTTPGRHNSLQTRDSPAIHTSPYPWPPTSTLST